MKNGIELLISLGCYNMNIKGITYRINSYFNRFYEIYSKVYNKKRIKLVYHITNLSSRKMLNNASIGGNMILKKDNISIPEHIFLQIIYMN